jgi:hypothetical protein
VAGGIRAGENGARRKTPAGRAGNTDEHARSSRDRAKAELGGWAERGWHGPNTGQPWQRGTRHGSSGARAQELEAGHAGSSAIGRAGGRATLTSSRARQQSWSQGRGSREAGDQGKGSVQPGRDSPGE